MEVLDGVFSPQKAVPSAWETCWVAQPPSRCPSAGPWDTCCGSSTSPCRPHLHSDAVETTFPGASEPASAGLRLSPAASSPLAAFAALQSWGLAPGEALASGGAAAGLIFHPDHQGLVLASTGLPHLPVTHRRSTYISFQTFTLAGWRAQEAQL